MLSKTNRSQFLFKTQILLILMTLILSFFSGCSSSRDLDTIISICNYDDDDMTVELRRAEDDSVVDSFDLEKLVSPNICDEFKNMAEGRYYLIIFYEGTTNERDRTGAFTIEDEDQISYLIDSHEDIEKI